MDDWNDDIKPSIPLPRSVVIQQPFSQLSLGASTTDIRRSEKTKSISTNNNRMIKQDAENLPEHIHSWTWKVNKLWTVPLFHPLECTAVVLKDIALDDISARISIFMRLNSISCNYHSDLGRVDCLTPCLIKFSVQLWRRNDDDDVSPKDAAFKKPDVVILEISRLQGCAIGMQRLRNWLVYAVTTGEQPRSRPQNQEVGSKCPGRILREMYEQYVQSDVGAGEESHCKGALLITLKLLECNCMDQNRLGLESLCALTNPSTLCEGEADWVANAIVYGQGEFGSHIQSVLTKYFQRIERTDHTQRVGGDLIFDTSDESGLLEYAQGCSFGRMHNFALRVLKNSLERIVSRKVDNQVDLTCSFWKTVLPTLAYNMEVAEQRPHEASLAAKCISLLDSLEPMVWDYFKEDRLVPVAIHAHEFGKTHHLTLERESGNLLQTLRFVHNQHHPHQPPSSTPFYMMR